MVTFLFVEQHLYDHIPLKISLYDPFDFILNFGFSLIFHLRKHFSLLPCQVPYEEMNLALQTTF